MYIPVFEKVYSLCTHQMSVFAAPLTRDQTIANLYNVIEVIVPLACLHRYRVQYESLLQVEKEQTEFFEDFGIK